MPTPSFFRNDGWVKSAQGAAVPGAQIYVCSQPANVDTVPPSPLADLFEDAEGLVPITQPILTDGFGHYDFYVAPDTYTVVVAASGVIQQVYIDQSIGLAGGSGSVELQVNGVDNESQEVLDLADSDTITFEDLGGGQVTAHASSSSFGYNSPWFWSNGATSLSDGSSSNSFDPRANSTDNKLVCLLVFLPTCTVRSLTFRLGTVVGTPNVSFGLYDQFGNKVLDSGSIDLTAGSDVTQTVTLGSPVNIVGGMYYFVQTGETVGGHAPSVSGWTTAYFTLASSAPRIFTTNNSTRFSLATNLRVAGVLPNTLGSLSAGIGGSNYAGIALVLFSQ